VDESKLVLRPAVPFLDERVARAKFTEASRLYEQRALFAPRGWVIDPPVFPLMTVQFLDQKQTVRCGVELQLRNYDFLPASVIFTNADRQPHTDMSLGSLLRPYEVSHVPPAIKDGFMLRMSGGGYLPGLHPLTLRPFLCVRGVWEYHTHPQHVEILWESIRGLPGYGLQYVIEQAHNALRPEVFR